MDGSKLNQEAAESYSRSFSSKILDNFFSSHEGISGQQIIDITPVKQVNFFVLKNLFNQWQEETKKFQSPFFNYRNNDVKTALKALVNTLSKNIYVQREAFQVLLEKAVVETLSLLYSPKEYYQQEWQNLPKSNSIKSFKAISKYIKLHRELFDSIINELEGLQSEIILDTEFNNILKSCCDSYSPDKSLVNKEAELFNGILPIDIVDTDLEDVHSELESQTGLGDNSREEPSDTSVNPDVLTFGSEPIPEEATHTHDVESIEAQDTIKGMDDEFSPVTYHTETADESPDEDPIDSQTINDQFAEEKKTINQQFGSQSKPKPTIADQHANHPISDLVKSINVNQRYMFLNDLFDGNINDYENALNDVEHSQSFDDSVEILVQNYSKKYRWDMNSEEVKELLKVIFKRFR